MNRKSQASLIFALILAPVLVAQEGYWVANRNSSTLSKVWASGKVAQTVTTPTTLRRVVQAPDGKLWVVRFIQTTMDIYDASGAPVTTVVNPTGSAFDVAFDKGGHAWVTGGTSTNEFSASGMLLNSYPMPAAAPLGITIDNLGNKWIAHRTTPASISKIDGTTAAVTNYLLPTTAMLPTVTFADWRGLGVPSHIWVIGDSSGQIVEFDQNGVALNTYASLLTSIGSLAQDPITGDLFIGSFGNGGVVRMSLLGAIVNSFVSSPSVLGLSFDSFGRLLATVRISPTTTALSEIRRYDISNNTLEVVTQVGTGTQSPISTRQQFALVVDPTSDTDGDAVANSTEVLQGTSPFDMQSNGFTSLNTTGVTASGSLFEIKVQAPPTANTFIAVAGGFMSPGVSVTGIGGLVWLDLTSLVFDPVTGSPFLFVVPGSVAIPIAIPPGLGGLFIGIQGLTGDVFGAQFSNAASLFVYI